MMTVLIDSDVNEDEEGDEEHEEIETAGGKPLPNFFNFIVAVRGQDHPVFIVPTPTARLVAAEHLPSGWGELVLVPREEVVDDDGA
jgi:hypothetical protein